MQECAFVEKLRHKWNGLQTLYIDSFFLYFFRTLQFSALLKCEEVLKKLDPEFQRVIILAKLDENELNTLKGLNLLETCVL